MNIISVRKHIFDTDVVDDGTCLGQSVRCNHMIFNLQSWTAIVLPPALAAAAALAKCLSFYLKVFYVMGKALSGELSCPCDRSCL